MSSFETFVATELTRRPTMLLPDLVGGYDDDPNLPGAPAILQNSPTGTYYLQSTGALSIKNSATPGTWAAVGSGGGGGGGAKTYATEAALLGASDTAGTFAYATDTGSFWFRRASSWQEIPNHAVLRRTEGNYQITVDPVAGDDAEWNDGTVTPLRTLEALFKRLPAMTTQGAFSTWHNPADSITHVLLKAGTHTIPVGASINDYLNIDVGRVAFYGELSTGVSFTVDHWSASKVIIFQPTSNPAWTVDEHVGKVAVLSRLVSGVPTYYYWHIIANDAYSITVAVTSQSYATIFPAGSTVVIKEFATTWAGARPLYLTGSQPAFSRGSAFNLIKFDTTNVPANRPCFYLYSGAVSFFNCLFTSSPPGVVHQLMQVLGQGADAFFYQGMWKDMFVPISASAGYVSFYHTAAVNTQRIVELSGWSSLYISGDLFLRDCNDVFFGNGGNGPVNMQPFQLYCTGLTGVGGLFFFNIGHQLINARGAYLIAPDPLAIPNNLFSINDGNKLMLRSWSLEGKNHSLLLGGYGAGPQVSISIADLTAVYGKYYDYGYGCTVQAV